MSWIFYFAISFYTRVYFLIFFSNKVFFPCSILHLYLPIIYLNLICWYFIWNQFSLCCFPLMYSFFPVHFGGIPVFDHLNQAFLLFTILLLVFQKYCISKLKKKLSAFFFSVEYSIMLNSYLLVLLFSQKGKRHVYPNVHHSTVYNSQDMEAT